MPPVIGQVERIVTRIAGHAVVYEIDVYGYRRYNANRQNPALPYREGTTPYGKIVAIRHEWQPNIKWPRPYGRFECDLGLTGVAPLVLSRAGDYTMGRLTEADFGVIMFDYENKENPEYHSRWMSLGEPPPHNSMTMVNGNANYSATGTSNTFSSWGFTPTSGNLLIAGLVLDQPDTIAALSGWTQIHNSSYHGATQWNYKTSAGSESSVSWSGFTDGDNQAFVAEYNNYDGGGLDTSATAENGSNVASVSAGPTATLSAQPGVCIAIRTNSSHTGNPGSWTSSQVTLTEDLLIDGGTTGEAWGTLASDVVTATSAITVQGNNTSNDQIFVGVGYWVESGGAPAGGPVAGSLALAGVGI